MKRIILSLVTLMFLLSSGVISQPLLKQWDYRFGGKKNDYLYALHQTNDGGYILGGTSQSSNNGDKTQSSWGGGDYWIVKIDSSGSKQWDVRFGGSEDDDLTGIAPIASGGFLLTGYSKSGISGDKTQENWGNGFDFWIVKTDANGAKVWDLRYGGTNAEVLAAALPTQDGGFLLGGYSASNISGDKSQSSIGGSDDYWIIKIDSNGNKQWDKTYGTEYADLLQTMQPTSDGGFILGGVTYYYNSSGYDLFIIKIDDDGTEQWRRTFSTSTYDFLKAITQEQDGSFIIGAFSYDALDGDKTQPSHGGSDYWIIKIDALGNKLWDVSLGGDGDDFLNSQLPVADGLLFYGYTISGASGDVSQESRGSADYWIIKTDFNGQRIWDTRFGGDSFDNLMVATQTRDSGYLFGGYSGSNSSGDKSQDSWNSYDYWILKTGSEIDSANLCLAPSGASATNITSSSAKLSWSEVDSVAGYMIRYRVAGNNQITMKSATTNSRKLTGLTPNTSYVWQVKTFCDVVPPGLHSDWSSQQFFTTGSLKLAEEQSTTLSVYPNPTNGQFKIAITLGDEKTSSAIIQVINSLGQIMYNEKTSVANGMLLQEINLKDLPAGMYLVKVIVNDQVYSAPINCQK